METILRQIADAITTGDKELVQSLVYTLLENNPTDSTAHLTAAKMYRWLNKLDRCYLHAAVAIALSPDTPAPYTYLSQLGSSTLSRETVEKILKNGWECKSRILPKKFHEEEREDYFRSFNEKHKTSVD